MKQAWPVFVAILLSATSAFAQGAVPTVNVQPPVPSALCNQRVVATGTPIQLTSCALKNGEIGTADTTNTSNIFYGSTQASVTAIDGTGPGYPIQPGFSVSDAVPNMNSVWVNGIAGQVIYFKGN